MVLRTVERINKQYQEEVGELLAEYERVRQGLGQKDKEIKRLERVVREQEQEIAQKNTRLVSGCLLELNRERDCL